MEKYLDMQISKKYLLAMLYQRMQQCKACEYAYIDVNLIKKLWGKPGKREILVISQNPSYFWLKKGYSLPYVMGALDSFDRRYGNILTKKLQTEKLSWDEIYITNVLKCATFKNEKPITKNVDLCIEKWLTKEIAIISPKKIIVLGEIAKRGILKAGIAERFKTVFMRHPSSVRDASTAKYYVERFVGELKNGDT